MPFKSINMHLFYSFVESKIDIISCLKLFTFPWDHGILEALICYISLVQLCGPSKTGIKPLKVMGIIKTLKIFKTTQDPYKHLWRNLPVFISYLVSGLFFTDCKMKVNILHHWPSANSLRAHGYLLSILGRGLEPPSKERPALCGRYHLCTCLNGHQ